MTGCVWQRPPRSGGWWLPVLGALGALVAGATPAGAGHVTVYDQCAGPQESSAVVALSVSLPPGGSVVGVLYGEDGAAETAGSVDGNGIVELRFPPADPDSFYEWVAHDSAAPDHEIAAGGLAGDGPPCSGSQLRPAPAATTTSSTTTTTTEPAEEPDPAPPAGEESEPQQEAPAPQPVLPPPPPAVAAPPAAVVEPDEDPGDVGAAEPADDETTLALPPTVPGASPAFGGAVASVVLVPTEPSATPLTAPVAAIGDDALEWAAFLTATLLVLWLVAALPIKRTPSLTAVQLVNKRHRPPA